jgi:hypothetical protein
MKDSFVDTVINVGSYFVSEFEIHHSMSSLPLEKSAIILMGLPLLSDLVVLS